METKIVERNIGRAGNKAQMIKKQNEWDKKYGKGNWLTGYEVDGKFLTREETIQQVYDKAYFEYLDNNPKIVKELIQYSGCFNPHSYFTNSVDIQAEAVIRYMNVRGLTFLCNKKIKIAIGTWQPRDISKYEQGIKDLGYTIHYNKIQYNYISQLLSPYKIKTLQNPSLSVEEFWQSSCKCLAIKI